MLVWRATRLPSRHMTAPVLYPQQRAALGAIAARYANGQNRLLVKMPTGTGKTVMFAALPQQLRAWLDTFPARSRGLLVIAHREELLDQAAEKIQAQNHGLMVSVEQADRHAYAGSDVVIASIQTLAARKFTRLHRLLQRFTPRIVVVDEAHHAAADTYRTALVHLGFLPPSDASDKENIEAVYYDDVLALENALREWDRTAPQDRLLVGVTATPNRADAVGLGAVFQALAYNYSLKEAIKDQLLVPPIPWVIETQTSLDAVRITAGEFNQKDLAETVNTPERNLLAVTAWREKAADVSTIAFTVDVAHAHDLAAAFTRLGIRAMPVSGETPKDERHQILNDYTTGRIQVITNCQVFTEGVDLPRTGCILMAKPTKSATLFEQCVGRGLRLFPGKTKCVLLDVVDVSRRHSLQTAAVLYGLPPGLVAQGKPLDQLADEFERFLADNPTLDQARLFENGQHLTLEQLKAKATTFNIWAVKALGAFGVGRALDWLKCSEDEYRIAYPWADGTETVAVRRDLVGQWEVVCTLRPRDFQAVRQRTLLAGAQDAEIGADFAEHYIFQERHSVTRLKSKDAGWKRRPATEKQLAVLRRRGVPFNPRTITCGDASALIDLSNRR